MSGKPAAVVIGANDDPHVAAVLDHLPPHVLVADASTLANVTYALKEGRFTATSTTERFAIDVDRPVRGWIRRLAPPRWHHNLTLESHAAAVKTAWLSLLTAVIRTCGVRWLTGVDQLIVGESKILQIDVARAVGVQTPETIITNDRDLIRQTFGSDVVLKPLGASHFYDGEDAFAVFATGIATDDPALDALPGAPFIAQERLDAREHLRVVTVADRLWAARLDANSRPLDWRRQDVAHRSFRPAVASARVQDGALAMAGALGLGYSSQDWLVTDAGEFLLDVNPAGQWLFLPDDISNAVSRSIATWLLGGQV